MRPGRPEETTYALCIRNGVPTVICQFGAERAVHRFDGPDDAIRFYEQCVRHALAEDQRERYRKAVAARLN